jgi:hypothetical protein
MSGTAPATTPYSATGAASPRTGPHPVTMTRRATAVIGNVIGLRVENLYLANNMILSGQKSSDSATPATKTAPARATPPSPPPRALHDNWDSVNKTVMYHGANDTTLPASLYLTSKPSWWGSMQWPAIGPELRRCTPPLRVPARETLGGIIPGTRRAVPRRPPLPACPVACRDFIASTKAKTPPRKRRCLAIFGTLLESRKRLLPSPAPSLVQHTVASKDPASNFTLQM